VEVSIIPVIRDLAPRKSTQSADVNAGNSVMISSRNHLTADLCRTKAKECLYLAQQTMTQSHRIMLEHIAETWYRIADSLPANDT